MQSNKINQKIKERLLLITELFIHTSMATNHNRIPFFFSSHITKQMNGNFKTEDVTNTAIKC